MQNSYPQIAGVLPGIRITLSRAVELFLDPFVALCTMFLAVWYLGETVHVYHLLLALVLLLVTFPGSLKLSESVGTTVRQTLSDWAMVTAMLISLGFVSGYIRVFSFGFVIAWPLTALAGLLASRVLAHQAVPYLVDRSQKLTFIVVGANEVGITLASNVVRNKFSGLRFLGYFDDRTQERLGDIDTGAYLGELQALADYVKRDHVDRIYIALPMASQPRILSLLEDVKDTTASVFFVPDIFVTDLIQGRLESIEGMPVVAVCETPFTGLNGVLKRCSDIALSLVILALISPVFLAVAFGVRLSSPGPVIFAQRRYGLDGRDIVVYKFRSMTVTEDGDKAYKQVTRGDARVTPFGEFIRKTSLDELPQFINVLQGRMSIVGPRPHAVAVNETYRRLIPSYMIRHKVKPGITGWAQVNGFRGGDDLDHMKKRIQFDLEYVRRWSLRLDLQIIFRTIGLVAKDSRAY